MPNAMEHTKEWITELCRLKDAVTTARLRLAAARARPTYSLTAQILLKELRDHVDATEQALHDHEHRGGKGAL